MASGNKYQGYLNDNRDSSPNIVKTIANTGAKVFGAAALLGGGYYGFKRLESSGIVSKAFNSSSISKGINYLRQGTDTLGSYVEGVSKTLKSSGYMRVLSGDANEELKANLTETLTRAKMGQIRPLSGDPTKFEKFLYDVADARKEFATRTIENVRLDNLIKEVKDTTADEKTATFIEKVLKAERDNRKLLDSFRDDSGGDGRKFIAKVLDEHQGRAALGVARYQDAQAKLASVLPKHQLYQWDKATRKYKINGEYVKANRDAISEQYRAIEEQYKKAIVNDLGRASKSKVSAGVSTGTGLSRLTVGKAVEMGIFNTPINFKKRPITRLGSNGLEILDMMDMNPQTIAESLRKDDVFWKQIKDAYVDPMVFVTNKSNNVLDLRFPGKAVSKSIKVLADNIQVPFVNIRPFKILSGALRLGRSDMPLRTTFSAKSVMPTINNSLGELGEDHFYFAGTIVDSSGKVVKDKTYLASSKFGPWQRAITAMSGHTHNPKIDIEPKTVGEYIKKNILSIGYQDFESSFARKSTAVTKFWDTSWERNIWKELTRRGSDASTNSRYVQNAFSKFFSTVDSNVRALDNDSLQRMAPYLNGILSEETINKLINGTQKDGTMSAIFELLQKDAKHLASVQDSETTLAYKSQLEVLFKQFKADPDSFDKPFRTFKHGHGIVAPDVFEAMSPNTSDVLTKIDDAEKILHAELLNQIELGGGPKFTVQNMVEQMIKDGATEADVAGIKKLNVHKQMQLLAGSDYYQGRSIEDRKLSQFSRWMASGNQSEIRNQLKDIVFGANPVLGYGPGKAYDSIFKGSDYLVINQAKAPHVLRAMNEAIARGEKLSGVMKAGYGNFSDTVFHQLGVGGKGRYGRNHLDQVTTATNFTYYGLFRLNEGLSKAGLGLSYRDMGSTQDIAKNLFLKRILAPYAIYKGFDYLNDETGNIMGEKPTQTFGKMYADITVGVQAIKQFTGLNSAGSYINRLLPGFERLYENPLGIAAKVASFGIFGETKSPEEMAEYYREGMDPIRKGRFWSVGSSTPIYGDRIKYYQPNWYRRLQSDYMMTDSMYGSTNEYWANFWLPNPRNPLGAANPLTWQHWKYKHWNDRPYPTSGTMLEQIPLVGPILDATIGRVAVPFRRRAGLDKAHREYLAEINAAIEEQARQGAEVGGYLYMTPGGRITPTVIEGESDNVYGGVPGSIVATEEGSIQVVDGTSGFGPMKSGSYIAKSDLTSRNMRYVSKSYVRQLRPYAIQSLRENIMVENLQEAVDPNSIGYRLGQTYYSATEIAGIYGFLTTSVFGDLTPDIALQSATRMTNFERMFWDQELGGVGGEISEIYRRFLPHRRRSINEYNPFRNTMPTWMPGPEYFMDFRHGDPYVKVEKGEMRLPGAGYESLNKLHPDVFGRYGALDRFKILADVAPWSEQYKYYSGVVTKMHSNKMISDEDFESVGKIRDMVSQKKEKYDLHPYRYRYADVDRETVTVLRWLDKETFLTKEHPANPIRLAGMKMPAQADTSPEAEEARAYLNEIIKPGARIRIGLDSDPVNRVRDDVMGTMHAVVYDTAGDPLNARMVKRFGKSVKANYDDTSATATNALYNTFEIGFGKVWESFAHMDTPLHTKLLQIRSPLEMYKRKELYGKSWQTWSHPIRDQLQPTFESFWTQNPIMASVLGGGIGWLFGVFGRSKVPTTIIGAAVGGLGATARTVGELTQRTILGDEDYTWVPRRRQQEREIEEYFDILKYVKYRGLYEKTRRLAIKYEGIDPESFNQESRKRASSTSYLKNKLQNAKKWLKINTGHPLADDEETVNRLTAIGDELDILSENKTLYGAGPYTMRALQYREEYKSTLYGADPNGDLMNIYRAMPKKDRPFFKYFMLAAPEEREEILRLVPKNQKRFYQAKWGLEVDDKPSLMEYFSTHTLPGANWEGWNPEYSVDELKLKFVHNEGLEIGEFGFWEDDLKQVKNAPDVGKIKNLNFLDVASLTKVLEGRGITDAEIQVELMQNLPDMPTNPIDIAVNIVHDRKKDISNAINNNLAFLLGGE